MSKNISMTRKIEANTIDEVYAEITRLQRLHGRERVIVDQKDLYGFLRRETFLNENGVVQHRVKWSVNISISSE